MHQSGTEQPTDRLTHLAWVVVVGAGEYEMMIMMSVCDDLDLYKNKVIIKCMVFKPVSSRANNAIKVLQIVFLTPKLQTKNYLFCITFSTHRMINKCIHNPIEYILFLFLEFTSVNVLTFIINIKLNKFGVS